MTLSRIITHPTSTPDTSGPDRRIRLTEATGLQFGRSSWTGKTPEDHGGLLNTHVEVQAFMSSGVAVIAVVLGVTSGLDNYAGQTMAFATPDEARAIAEALVLAANDAERVRVTSNRPEPMACGEVLYDGDQPFASCTQESGVEHSHNDLTAAEAVEAGHARLLSDADVLTVA